MAPRNLITRANYRYERHGLYEESNAFSDLVAANRANHDVERRQASKKRSQSKNDDRNDRSQTLRTHTHDSKPRRGSSKQCDFCHKYGHLKYECHLKKRDERQKNQQEAENTHAMEAYNSDEGDSGYESFDSQSSEEH